MNKDKENRLIEVMFNQFGGMDNFLKAWKIIAKEYEKVKTDAEQDYIPTFESMKAYLQGQGLILPKNFKQFWKWFVLKYGDEVDESGMIEITQEMLNDFSRQRTNELNKPSIGTQPEGTGIDSIYDEQQLRQIFLKLHEANCLSGRQSDFVYGFQPGALPSGWQQIEWKLKNTELSVLVYRLTGKKRPVPAQVGKIFKTNTKFDSVAGSRGDAEGGKVYTLINPLL